MKYYRRFKGIIVIIIFGLFLASCTQAEKVDANNVLKYTILKRGYIKAAYAIYPPASMQDPNNDKLTGIFIEVLEEAANNLGLQVKWVEEVPWGTMIEGLKNERYDIIGSGVWSNSSRARGADFTIPIYYNAINAYVRHDENRFEGGLSDLYKYDQDKIKISTIDGEMSDLIANIDFPNAKKVSLPQLSEGTQLLLEVATGKSDVTFVQPYTAEEYMKKNPNKIKELKGEDPVRVFPTVFMLKDNEYAFKSMLNEAIIELINSGFVDRVIAKYVGDDASFIYVKRGYNK